MVMRARLLIYDRKWQCRWDRFYPASDSSQADNKKTAASSSVQESMQLTMGMCYSVRSMLNKLARTRIDAPGSGPPTFCLRTNRYRLHYYETLSGWKFVLLLPIGISSPLSSSPVVAKSCQYAGQTVTLENAMAVLFSTVFLEWIIRNPLINDESLRTGEKFNASGIATNLEEFMHLPIFGLPHSVVN